MLKTKDITVIAMTAVQHSGHSVGRGMWIKPLRDGSTTGIEAFLKRSFPKDAGWFGMRHALHIVPRQYVEQYIATRQVGTGNHLYPLLSIWTFSVFITKSSEFRIGTVIAVTKAGAKEAATRLLVKQGVPIAVHPFALERIPRALLYEEPAEAPSEREIRRRFTSYLG